MFLEISPKNNFFTEHLRAVASVWGTICWRKSLTTLGISEITIRIMIENVFVRMVVCKSTRLCILAALDETVFAERLNITYR